MIKIDNLDEYVSIKTVMNYCASNKNCDKCKIKFLCDLCNGDRLFKNLSVQYEPKKEEENEY